MQKCYLDSNILIYLKDDNSPYQEKALKILQSLISTNCKLYISSLVLDEFIYVLEKTLTVKNKKELYIVLQKAVKEIMEIPNLEIVNPPLDKTAHADVINLMEKYNLEPRDAYHLLILKSNKINYFATFDKDFKKVFLEKQIIPVK